MDFSSSNQFHIFQIYRQYCDITSVNAIVCGEAGYRQDEESKKVISREGLTQLLKLVESRVKTRISIFDELYLLMTQLDFTVEFSEFSRFYDFVFFMCRENCQKNISVERAVNAWRLVLAGRFRLLNQWCDFVEKNQRHNISEDTWQQVLAFSRCVHENLEGYDPEGAWPVLIDEFVEHMYRALISNEKSNFLCNCEDPLPGLRIFPGLKRKLPKDLQQDGMESSDTLLEKFMNLDPVNNCKRSRQIGYEPVNMEDNPPGDSADDRMEIVKHSSPLSSSNSPCAVERCLLKGFEGLFSTRSYLQLDKKRGVSFT